MSEVSRRRALKTLGAGLAASTAGCLGSITGGGKFQQQLKTVEEATKKYADPKKAISDGYKVMGPYVPGMGWHFNHPKWTKEAAKNGPSLEKPNLLTYVKTSDGLKLGSVEWGIPTKAAPDNLDLFADENADATEKWHPHKSATHVFAVPDGEQTKPSNVSPKQWMTNDHWSEFRPPDNELKPGDTASLNWGSLKGKEGEKSERTVDLAITHPDLTTLHAWIHQENPKGVFAPVNPEYSESGDHSH